MKIFNTLGCLFFFKKNDLATLRPLERKRLLSALLKNLQYQSYLSSDGTRDFLHNCSGRDHSVLLWMYVCNLKYFFFVIIKEKHKRKIQTWSPCRDIEAFKHGAYLWPLLKLYQLEHWIFQTQGIRGLCHSVIGISWSQSDLEWCCCTQWIQTYSIVVLFWFLVNDM